MSNVTTTKNGFRVEDITFKGARKQSAILDEIDSSKHAPIELILNL